MLVCLRHMDKNKKPYGPNEVYVVNSLQLKISNKG